VNQEIKGKTIVAMDTDQETLDWIQKGVIAATIAQKPFTMAFYGLKILDSVHHDKLASLILDSARDPFAILPAFVDTGAIVIDRNNISEFTRSRDSASSPVR
jgi:ribose transport system substrate-binding protein